MTPVGQEDIKHIGRLKGPAGSWSPSRASAPRGSQPQPDRQAGLVSTAQEVRKFLKQQAWAAEPVGTGRACAGSWALGTLSQPLLPPAGIAGAVQAPRTLGLGLARGGFRRKTRRQAWGFRGEAEDRIKRF